MLPFWTKEGWASPGIAVSNAHDSPQRIAYFNNARITLCRHLGMGACHPAQMPVITPQGLELCQVGMAVHEPHVDGAGYACIRRIEKLGGRARRKTIAVPGDANALQAGIGTISR